MKASEHLHPHPYTVTQPTDTHIRTHTHTHCHTTYTPTHPYKQFFKKHKKHCHTTYRLPPPPPPPQARKKRKTKGVPVFRRQKIATKGLPVQEININMSHTHTHLYLHTDTHTLILPVTWLSGSTAGSNRCGAASGASPPSAAATAASVGPPQTSGSNTCGQRQRRSFTGYLLAMPAQSSVLSWNSTSQFVLQSRCIRQGAVHSPVSSTMTICRYHWQLPLSKPLSRRPCYYF